ncbi:MAG: mRNA surveillance protein pelota [archaeon GB-1867-005]|nr:mRNA surveillance protein pelota [Candidatus Culexmicrobium cathedralense]
MKILLWDEKAGLMKLRVENQDDLWALYNIIEEGDIVYAKTTRELKVGNSSMRKPMILGIKVKKLEFQPFTERLRVRGVIIHEPEKYKERGLRGSHHTINLDIGGEIAIIKEKWPKHAIDRIREACRKTKLGVVILSIDDEEAAIAIIRDYGVEIISEIALRLPGKMEADKRYLALREKIKEVTKAVKSTIKNTSSTILIVAGPSYMREKVAAALEKEYSGKSDKPKIYQENTSNGGVRGIYEAIRRGSITKAVSEHGIIEETKLMAQFLKLLSKNENMVTYGLNEVKDAAKAGAIKALLVLDEMLHSYGEVREKIEEIIKDVERKGGKIKIFSSIHEAGRQLKSLGGVAAILRFKVRNKQ